MSLAAGTRLGPYEVTAQIGVGGMGEVWRATDTNLGRQVAIKVLPDAFAQDAERLARFEREAKTLASLNHSNIAAIFGLEKTDPSTGSGHSGTRALVMELVEGPTLADLIGTMTPEAESPGSRPRRTEARPGRGGGAPRRLEIDDALKIAKQIAEALEAAHEQGIIHRDLKPANVKVREDGMVKVLDFGLAKAMEPAGASSDMSHSPTITSPAMTAMGMILGTAAYMAPEQARGRPVDKRADIWAFGCVLFEMLTGRKAFEGEDVSLTLSKILQRDPDWTALPAGTPASVRRLLDRCLEKDPKRRLRDIGEARLALEVASATEEIARPTDVQYRALWQRPLPATIGAAALVAMTALAVWFVARSYSSSLTTADAEATAGTRHLNIVLPDDAPLVFIGEVPGGMGLTALALSPDGRRLAYVGRAGNTTRLYLRDMNDPTVRPLAGTEGAYAPFFSPDGQWVAFFAGQRLMRAAVTGGQVSPITEANWTFGGSWSDDGRIAMVTNDGVRLSVVESGGQTRLVEGLGTVPRMASPSWLPGGDWLLLTCYEPQHLCAVSVKTGERRHLVINGAAASTWEGVALMRGSSPRYVAPGFLFYGAPADNVLMAVRFEPRTLTVIGEPVELVRGVRRENITGALQAATTTEGDVVFSLGTNAVVGTLVWADGKGATPVHPSFGSRTYGPFFLSNGGRRIIIKAYPDTGPPEIWFLDITTGTERRWVDEGLVAGREPWPGPWIPGTTKVMLSALGAAFQLFEVDGERASGGRSLWSGTIGFVVDSIGKDGRLLLNVIPRAKPWYLSLVAPGEVGPLPPDATRILKPLVPSTGEQGLADLSPDMKWLTYTSDESGRYEVWAARLPVTRSPIQVSTEGCELPRWSPKGDRLYFRCGQRWYWTALTGADDPAFRPPEFFLEGDYLNIAGKEHAVSPDGSRLLLLQGSGERTRGTLDMITNWRAELERRLPKPTP